MLQRGQSIPRTVGANAVLAIRSCFIGARTARKQADERVDEMLTLGHELAAMTEEAAG